MDPTPIPTTETLAKSIIDYVADRYAWPTLSRSMRSEDVHKGIAAHVLNMLQPHLDRADRPARTDMFRLGSFRLHSAGVSPWKIDCDALTDGDVAALAVMLAEVLPPFGSVEGVPTGGLRLAAAMERFVTEGPLLVVDDVLTTGASMEEQRRGRDAVGAVVFARGPCPAWVTSLWAMPTGRGSVEALADQRADRIADLERALQRGICAYCGIDLVVDPSGRGHWEECEAHPARVRIAVLETKLALANQDRSDAEDEWGADLSRAQERIAELEAEVAHYRDAGAKTFHEVEQVLGTALGYPAYGPEMFPDGVPDGSVCVGEHVPESLADEAAARIRRLEAELRSRGELRLVDE